MTNGLGRGRRAFTFRGSKKCFGVYLVFDHFESRIENDAHEVSVTASIRVSNQSAELLTAAYQAHSRAFGHVDFTLHAGPGCGNILEAHDSLQHIHAKFYEVGAEITRLAARIAHPVRRLKAQKFKLRGIAPATGKLADALLNRITDGLDAADRKS